MPPPAPGHAPQETPAAAAQHAPAAGHAPTGARENFLATALEKTASGSWKLIKGICSYTSQLVRGTLSGVWSATAGAVGRGIAAPFQHLAKSIVDVGEIGKKMISEAKERHHIGKFAPAIKAIMLGTALSIGNALYLPFSPAVGAATGVIYGAEKVGSALVMKYDAHKGSTPSETSGQEEAA